VLIELGSNDFNVGSTTEGLVLLKKAYDEAPSYSLAENSYARGLYLTHDYVDALPLMKELASSTPGDFQTRASLAAVYLGVHDTASAISELNTVAKLNPEASTTVAAFITAIRAGKNPFNASSTPNQ
jgi:Flp pilus assembly protein TadD